MGMAWETTEEDIAAVIQDKFGVDPEMIQLDYIHNLLNHDAIEDAALAGGVEMEDQHESAAKEIEAQIIEMGWPAKNQDGTPVITGGTEQALTDLEFHANQMEQALKAAKLSDFSSIKAAATWYSIASTSIKNAQEGIGFLRELFENQE
jgi:hypothetical protein